MAGIPPTSYTFEFMLLLFLVVHVLIQNFNLNGYVRRAHLHVLYVFLFSPFFSFLPIHFPCSPLSLRAATRHLLPVTLSFPLPSSCLFPQHTNQYNVYHIVFTCVFFTKRWGWGALYSSWGSYQNRKVSAGMVIVTIIWLIPALVLCNVSVVLFHQHDFETFMFLFYPAVFYTALFGQSLSGNSVSWLNGMPAGRNGECSADYLIDCVKKRSLDQSHPVREARSLWCC